MTADAFWNFAVEAYARPHVSAACLALQDEHGADVNLVLFALWCARRGRYLDAPALDAAATAVAPWRESVVRPVRTGRRALSAGGLDMVEATARQTLRKQVLAVELAAERLQLGVLEALTPPPGEADPADAARRNLACLAALAGVPSDAPPLAVLARVVS